MDPDHVNIEEPTLEAIKRSPRTHVDSQPLPTDSMVTISLSESDAGQKDEEKEEEKDEDATTTLIQPEINIEDNRLSSRPTSAEILRGIRERGSQDSSIRTSSMVELQSPTSPCPEETSIETPVTPTTPERSRSDSGSSVHSAHVDWEELEKTEEQEARDEASDEVCSTSGAIIKF